MGYCGTCGTALKAGAVVCSSCGNPVAGSTAALPPGPTAGAPTSTAAIVSLALGIACYVVLPFIGAIGAVVAGHMARKEIRESNGRLGGAGLALTGLILGYAHFALFCFVAAIFLAIAGVAATGGMGR